MDSTSTKLNICHCGKNMRSLNSHNYRLHVKSCKQHKLSETSVKISTFFKVKTVKYATNVTDETVLDEHDCSSMNIKTANDVETITLIPSSSTLDTPNVIEDTVLDEHDCSSMDQNIETANDVEALKLIPPSSSLGKYTVLDEHDCSSMDQNIETANKTLSLISSGSSSDNRLTNDPGIIVKMKNLGPEMKKLIINIGPCQPTKDDFPAKTFPIDRNGRNFKDLWYFRLLTDGTKVLRDWLTYSELFDILGPINKILQTQDFDVINATAIINQTKTRVKNMREDSAFEKINIKVDNCISDLEYEIEPLKNKRLKRVPKKSGELSIDEPIKKFRIETYNTLFDVTLTEINSRFNVISCGVLNDLSLLTEKRIMEVRERNVLPDDSFLVFCQVYNKFVDRNALISEYLQFVVNYKEIESTIKLKSNLHTIINDNDLDEDRNSGDENYIDFSLYDKEEDQTSNCSKQNLASVGKLFKLFCTASLQNVFPNLYLTLKITVTLPVSSCTVERSFSKLKLIKTKLRTTMCQDRLEQMVKISCEPDISLDKDKIIDIFESKSTPLTKLLII
ncbi:unnamed protein product [Macrosiphum euphorbiae]|uniref:HAT C-terminal dimerisation domain-containing protein n=1 Tax=Macrosiphum euphorbiae TaxID=13131 RepID=A0AAV0Y072_9HEMI|nr:unnamed protein product [Macrosiphum euphorbiae]